MGLDVYVGSITRYLCRDWETVAQRYARESGLQIEIRRAYDPQDAITDPEEVRPVVDQWRESLSAGLEEVGGPSLNWDERAEAPYFTDKPTWEAYGDLLLWIAYTEAGKNPPADSVEDWQADPVFLSVLNDESPYASLLNEVWLPVDFQFGFRAAWVTGDELSFGSTQQLARVLEDLRARHFQATAADLEEWRREGKEHGAPLVNGARFAFSLFADLSEKAIQHRLVMLLDW